MYSTKLCLRDILECIPDYVLSVIETSYRLNILYFFLYIGTLDFFFFFYCSIVRSLH